ncbi:lipid II flippase MurJ [Ramlibacter montanisoli]|uniref:lipid II flippase MurJ n=1 Tax=Ramlibacter montanisoli TaxID=2732512 RepID=UPI001C0EB02B|nr:lipid II flippase MurJ [Ramlibacter montanisoli]
MAAVAWITSARLALQTVLLLPGMGKPVWPDLRTPAIALAWQRVKPLLLGTTYYKTDALVDRFLLSAAASGSLSLYYLAQQLYTAATEVMDKAIAAPLVPRLSTLHKQGDRAGFRRTYQRGVLVVSALSLAGLLLLGVAGEGLLDLVFGYKNFSAGDVQALWWILIWLAGMFIGAIAGQVAATAFYALGDTSTPTWTSAVAYTVYIPCKVAAFSLYGVMGLAVATSLYYLANLLVKLVLLQRSFADEPAPCPSP